jgi:hypothetical protein
MAGEGFASMRFFIAVIASVCLSAAPPDLQDGSLPNAALTPGDVLHVTRSEVCTPGYTKGVRSVSANVRRQIYSRYGRRPRPGICCEIDHLIPLELGGSNRVSNLWPEPYDMVWNAHVKDSLETYLHRKVCEGEVSLSSAQQAIASNWIEAYKRYYVGRHRSSRRHAN